VAETVATHNSTRDGADPAAAKTRPAGHFTHDRQAGQPEENTMLCAGYTRTVDMTDGDLVKLENARGTTLRVASGTLWVTQERDHHDIVLNAGDVWMVERDGLTLVEAQARTALCLVGPGAEPAQVRQRHGRSDGSASLLGWFARRAHA
jgi:hypothetical protein